MNVQSGDVFGIRYATADGAQLQLLFEDGGAGTRPESFRRKFTGSVVFDASGSAVESDTRYFPIVSVITGLSIYKVGPLYHIQTIMEGGMEHDRFNYCSGGASFALAS